MKKAIKAQDAYLLSLVCESIKTVEVTFNFGLPEVVRTYTYLTILDLEEGQDVIVEARDGLSIAQVVRVHDEAEIETNSSIQYKFALGTDSKTVRKEQERLYELVEKTLKELAAAKRKANRKRVKAELQEHFGEALESVKDNFVLTDNGQ